MEYVILGKFLMVMNIIVKTGYTIAGGYLVKTGIIYVNDYKESVEKERNELAEK